MTEPVWQSSYSVGNEILDQQHRKILVLCARAIDCLESDKAEVDEQAHQILNELQSYADLHFRTEEQILSLCNYPHLAEQKAEHLDFSRRLADMLYAASQGLIDKAGICVFLSGWWRGHILESDRQYSTFLRKY